MKRLLVLTALSVAALFGYTANAVEEILPDNPASPAFQSHQKANAERVTALLDGKGDLAFFSVPAMSEVKRMADSFPEDGQFAKPVRIVAARGEYEPGSFQLFSLKDRQNVTFDVPALKSKNGAVLPASAIDMKVVKIWFQCGNGWYSYFTDVGLRLCPELLLHDENLVKADTEKVANYARVRKDGRDEYLWITAPTGMKSKFDEMQPGFEDAKTLQPVELKKNQFKQFMLTVGIPQNQRPGVYGGTITVKENGSKIGEIPVRVCVLPFDLPTPRVYRNLDRVYLSSVMWTFSWKEYEKVYKDKKLAEQKYRELLASLKAHDLFYPNVDQDERSIALLKTMGFPTDTLVARYGTKMPWFHRFAGKLTYDERQVYKAAAKESSEFYRKALGHNNVLLSFGDEHGQAFVVMYRELFAEYGKYGFSIGLAGHQPVFVKGGYCVGYHPFGGDPNVPSRTKKWADTADNVHIGFYAMQHTGSENPAFIRRQNGLVSLFNDCTMSHNYEFAWSPWNDRETNVYKPMVIAYRSYGGLVDTLQYEGFREAIDDIRYISKLKLLAREAERSGNHEAKLQARKATQYLALLETEECDLDQVRAEVIQYILKLMNVMAKKG